ncbi:flagellar hook-basal body complex protein FliE [Serpentinicella sp. ANB-PHB4]|uniref:flagellar hook-basal body complex protein FliE n=1 Tax=Serpentinicella sp. ANB-PHB4 TaxID=3074076 RepID=UPI0028660BFD|nr:flagellar hook-basal body complex protein FliE [Serpentinicella sp. ANB-PHB4]MDR5658273.1 flagellar hook-basal body complex protein FliE [Serpentinicella sp. ANB-PHB4]
MNQVQNITNINKDDLGLFKANKKVEGASFAEFLSQSIQQVNKLDQQANEYSDKIASGQLDNIHEAMIASEKAEISMRFMLEIRSKVLDAYNEIMRMQI